MALLQSLWIVHTTSNVKDSDTDAELTLYAVRPNSPDGDYVTPFPDLSYNEREKGRTDEYRFDVRGKGIDEEARLSLRIGESRNGWLPSSIWAIGYTEDKRFVVLAHQPAWDQSKWFDNTGDEATRKRAIN